MRLLEIIRVSIFVAALFAVYAAAILMVIRWAHRRFKPEVPPASLREIRFRRVIFVLAALGLLCIGYGYFVEPYWLEVTHVRIETPKLAKGTRPIRIVLFSDVHCEAKPRLEERLPEVIAAEKPDLIAFTGDSLNSIEGLPVFKRLLTRLSSTAPSFCVRGNWDIERWGSVDLFGNTGARELKDEAVKVKIDGTELWVAGAPMGDHADIAKALSGIPPGAFTVLLYHSPEMAMGTPRGKVDLYLTGHTHGGQVALPFYGALMTGSRFGKRFEAGLYTIRQMWLYVSRGIGLEGDFAPPVRFFARPEVTVLEVLPASRR